MPDRPSGVTVPADELQVTARTPPVVAAASCTPVPAIILEGAPEIATVPRITLGSRRVRAGAPLRLRASPSRGCARLRGVLAGAPERAAATEFCVGGVIAMLTRSTTLRLLLRRAITIAVPLAGGSAGAV